MCLLFLLIVLVPIVSEGVNPAEWRDPAVLANVENADLLEGLSLDTSLLGDPTIIAEFEHRLGEDKFASSVPKPVLLQWGRNLPYRKHNDQLFCFGFEW